MPGTVWLPLVLGVVAAIAGGGLVGAILAHKRGTAQNSDARLARVEDRLAALESKHARLWVYLRQVIDLYYRWRKDDAPPLPDMPDDLI